MSRTRKDMTYSARRRKYAKRTGADYATYSRVERADSGGGIYFQRYRAEEHFCDFLERKIIASEDGHLDFAPDYELDNRARSLDVPRTVSFDVTCSRSGHSPNFSNPFSGADLIPRFDRAHMIVDDDMIHLADESIVLVPSFGEVIDHTRRVDPGSGEILDYAFTVRLTFDVIDVEEPTFITRSHHKGYFDDLTERESDEIYPRRTKTCHPSCSWCEVDDDDFDPARLGEYIKAVNASGLDDEETLNSLDI